MTDELTTDKIREMWSRESLWAGIVLVPKDSYQHIAWLLEKVAEQASEIRSLSWSIKQVCGCPEPGELEKYKRAHAWFIETMSPANANPLGTCNYCDNDIRQDGHKSGCRWLAAKELLV